MSRSAITVELAFTGRVTTLQALAPGMRSTEAPSHNKRDQERLSLAVNCFCVSLLFNGRPAQEKHVTTIHGRGINDLIDQGAKLKLSPWHHTKDNPFTDLHIFEVHGGNGCELSGWWAELEDNVLAFLPFSGRTGLDEHAVACLISECQFPLKSLEDWVSSKLNGGAYATSDVIAELPEALRETVGPSFRSRERRLAMCNDRGSDSRPLFSVYENHVSISCPETLS